MGFIYAKDPKSDIGRYAVKFQKDTKNGVRGLGLKGWSKRQRRS